MTFDDIIWSFSPEKIKFEFRYNGRVHTGSVQASNNPNVTKLEIFNALCISLGVQYLPTELFEGLNKLKIPTEWGS
jgi:hypothetical protein